MLCFINVWFRKSIVKVIRETCAAHAKIDTKDVKPVSLDAQYGVSKGILEGGHLGLHELFLFLFLYYFDVFRIDTTTAAVMHGNCDDVLKVDESLTMLKITANCVKTTIQLEFK